MQLSLITNSIDTSSDVLLERKTYIQPFEEYLANAEVAGLLQGDAIAHSFEFAAPDVLRIKSPAEIDFLRQRLTYWQRVGTQDDMRVTTQVLYELSDRSSVDFERLSSGDIDPKSIHKRRKLRYGPHGLHEYRGKFFPQLVRSLINAAGLHKGDVVIDPMCGSGTTNCESRAAGMVTIGMDLNPLSVLIAQTKSGLMDLQPKTLLSFANYVLDSLESHYQSSLGFPIGDCWGQHDIEYLRRWFAPKALEDVGVILQSIDGCTHPVVNDFLRICLSNILRKVSWQKEDDLRVRKEVVEYKDGFAVQLFSEEVRKQLDKLTPYLGLLEQDESPFPDFAITDGDARLVNSQLGSWEGQCDLLVTSPPYATALPYLDTDRLSLIVLGLLPRRDQGLRDYDMIGNREISESQRIQLWETYAQRRKELPSEVCDLIDFIAKTNHKEGVGFRRRNLPALLSKYFLDMSDAMLSAHKMMKPDRYGFYVVGNNSTTVDNKRLEIPTDRFLWEIARRVGWHQEKFFDMDLLPSRDIFRKNRGSAESILVFRSSVRRTAIYGSVAGNGQSVVDQGWDFHGEDTQEHVHALHPYPARFIPQIPRKAIIEYSSRGQTVLDPFCGGGTALLEASLLGRKSIGVDNNAVAYLISVAKTSKYAPTDIDALNRHLSELSDHSMFIRPIVPDYLNRDYWFSPESLADLGRIRGAIEVLADPSRNLALAVFSALIVRASHQDSDTRYARVDRNYTKGSAINWYQQRLRSALVDVQEISEAPRESVEIYHADGRNLEFITASTVDLVVTSPPYLNAYDYHKYHRHRLHWIGGDVAFARDLEIGKHDTFTKPKATPDQYFADMEMCFREWARVLSPSGKVFIVVGDAIVSGQPVAVADKFIEMMEGADFTLLERLLRNLQTSKKSFNQNARISQEHILLFEKKLGSN